MEKKSSKKSKKAKKRTANDQPALTPQKNIDSSNLSAQVVNQSLASPPSRPMAMFEQSHATHQAKKELPYSLSSPSKRHLPTIPHSAILQQVAKEDTIPPVPPPRNLPTPNRKEEKSVNVSEIKNHPSEFFTTFYELMVASNIIGSSILEGTSEDEKEIKKKLPKEHHVPDNLVKKCALIKINLYNIKDILSNATYLVNVDSSVQDKLMQELEKWLGASGDENIIEYSKKFLEICIQNTYVITESGCKTLMQIPQIKNLFLTKNYSLQDKKKILELLKNIQLKAHQNSKPSSKQANYVENLSLLLSDKLKRRRVAINGRNN